MDYFDNINPLKAEDRELLSNLTATFDLGTQKIIGQDEKIDKSDLMSEINENWLKFNNSIYILDLRFDIFISISIKNTLITNEN